MRVSIDQNDPGFQTEVAAFDVVVDGKFFDDAMGVLITADDAEGLVRYCPRIPGSSLVECWPDGRLKIQEKRANVAIFKRPEQHIRAH